MATCKQVFTLEEKKVPECFTNDSTLPDAVYNSFYTQTLTPVATLEPGNYWNIAVESGSLPSGIIATIDFGTPSIQGTSTDSGTFSFTIRISQSTDEYAEPTGGCTKAFTLTVPEAPPVLTPQQSLDATTWTIGYSGYEPESGETATVTAAGANISFDLTGVYGGFTGFYVELKGTSTYDQSATVHMEMNVSGSDSFTFGHDFVNESFHGAGTYSENAGVSGPTLIRYVLYIGAGTSSGTINLSIL